MISMRTGVLVSFVSLEAKHTAGPQHLHHEVTTGTRLLRWQPGSAWSGLCSWVSSLPAALALLM